MWWKTYYYLEIRFSCNGKGRMIDFLVLVSVDFSIPCIGERIAILFDNWLLANSFQKHAFGQELYCSIIDLLVA